MRVVVEVEDIECICGACEGLGEGACDTWAVDVSEFVEWVRKKMGYENLQ